MKRFLLAVAVVALSACVGSAEDAPAPTPVAPAAPVMVGSPVVVGAAPVYQYAPAPASQPARRGLFGRLRNRNNTASYTGGTTPMMAPMMAPPMTTVPGSTPMPSFSPTPMPTPMPMPGTKPVGTMAPGMVVPASGNLPAGTYTATDGTIVQVGGTEMAAPVSTAMTTQSARRGLFGRLRNR